MANNSSSGPFFNCLQ